MKRDPNSRGGSRFIHDELRVGHLVTITGPRNHFRLEESAEHSVLLQVGSALRRSSVCCSVCSRHARIRGVLHYSCRTRAEAAFLKELASSPQVHLNFDDESGGVLDLAAIVAQGARGCASLLLRANSDACGF